MKQHTLRYALFPVIVLFAFFSSALIAVLAAKSLGVWEEVFAGPIAAFSVVFSGYLIMPNYKITAASALLVTGAACAWSMLKNYAYPESHPLAYMPTLIPFISTCIGGVLALGACWLHQWGCRKK